MEYNKQTPELTAGGNSEALIATPTRLLVLPPSILKQTPIPDGIATAMEIRTPVHSPLDCISYVGHVSVARGVNPEANPTNAPITIQPSNA
jgi:hypothetical protein